MNFLEFLSTIRTPLLDKLFLLITELGGAPMRQLYMFYFKRIMPFIGGLVSRKSSWKYLNASVIAFPKASQFMAMMQVCGFSQVKVRKFTFGICSLFTGVKPAVKD